MCILRHQASLRAHGGDAAAHMFGMSLDQGESKTPPCKKGDRKCKRRKEKEAEEARKENVALRTKKMRDAVAQAAEDATKGVRGGVSETMYPEDVDVHASDEVLGGVAAPTVGDADGAASEEAFDMDALVNTHEHEHEHNDDDDDDDSHAEL